MSAAGVAPMAPAVAAPPPHAGHEAPAPGIHAAALHAPVPAHAAPRARSATQSVPMAPAWQMNELAGLFAPPAPAPEASDLPEIGIGQDDLDRLFGAAP